MTDLALKQLASGDWDLVMQDGDLQGDDTIRTAVLMSLLTDRDYPDGAPGQRRGYWGDTLLAGPADSDGSLLWRVLPGKRTQQALVEAQQILQAALANLIEDGIASSIDVTPFYGAASELDAHIQIHQPTGALKYRLSELWRQTLQVAA